MKVNGSFKFDSRMEQINRLGQTASKEALQRATRVIAQEARRRAPEGVAEERKYKGHPRLKSSISSSVKKSKVIDGAFNGAVYTHDGTGAIIEFGTGVYHLPHEGSCRASHGAIMAKSKPYMTFMYNGHLVRAKEVRGRKPTPFLYPALKAKAPLVLEYLKGEFNR